ncbi:MAG: septal ring lytic transglycosylase RlpA family protein [Thermosynechococcaceae cyanobacterium]
MKQVLLTGLAAALTVSAAGRLSSSSAQERPLDASQPEQGLTPFEIGSQHIQAPSDTAVTKVGERQLDTPTTTVESAVAAINVHAYKGRQATTIYVRNIPVVTFLGAELSASEATGIKVASIDPNARLALMSHVSPSIVNDPMWRATTITAKINQLVANGMKADSIKVVWSEKRKSFLIQANGQHLMEVSGQNTVLPNSTKDTAKDALQITNRLRYQLGKASPLTEIEGWSQPKKVRDVQTLALGSIRFRIEGMASWYGPGFDGNYTANGEIFNQYDLTAAHRSLPFGTRVRVTNLDNGRSVVVRINDRGPFIGDRVLDLSRGAAQVLGTVSSGVSPVRLDILQ